MFTFCFCLYVHSLRPIYSLCVACKSVFFPSLFGLFRNFASNHRKMSIELRHQMLCQSLKKRCRPGILLRERTTSSSPMLECARLTNFIAEKSGSIQPACWETTSTTTHNICAVVSAREISGPGGGLKDTLSVGEESRKRLPS